MDIRVGTGVDVHAFGSDPQRVLHLACLEWPGEKALEGHSDADVAAHAACDAQTMRAQMSQPWKVKPSGWPAAGPGRCPPP